jgi:hypothetical protein
VSPSQLRRAVLLAVGILAAGCSPAPQQTPPARPVAVRPVRIVVLADVSESVLYHHVEAIKPEHLRQLAQLVARAGGEIAFGTIPMPQDRPLVRASFSPSPTPPGRSSNVFRQMQAEGAYKRRLAEWEAVTGELVDRFVREAQVLLRPRRERGSPVFRALRMAEVLLTEPGAAGLRVVLASTDGFDTTQDPPVQKLPGGTRLLVVNGDGSVGSLAHLKPLRFGTMGAALEYVRQLTEVR